MNSRELTSIIACLGGTSYCYIQISYLTYYYMLISYFLDSVVYYIVKRCLIPLIITSMIFILRKFHPRGEESSVMNYVIAFCANRKWSNLFDISHCGIALPYIVLLDCICGCYLAVRIVSGLLDVDCICSELEWT